MKAYPNPSFVSNDICANEWQRPVVTYEIIVFRTGWKGAWDAFKAAWRGDQRFQVPTNITISAYFKSEDDIQYTWGMMIETGVTLNGVYKNANHD